MKHLVADVELEPLAATRIQELGLGSGQAQRDQLRASRRRVDAIVDREIEPPHWERTRS
jgi:hypothetical protein